VEEGASYILLFWHSPSLLPGLSPFVRSDDDLESFRQLIASYVERLSEFIDVEGATVGEIAERSAKVRQSAPHNHA
jgi:hypothetical protein